MYCACQKKVVLLQRIWRMWVNSIKKHIKLHKNTNKWQKFIKLMKLRTLP